MTKRDFFRHCGFCAVGLAAYCMVGSVAWGQSIRARLRPLGDASRYPGLRRRLAVANFSRIEQAFDFASRKAEIEAVAS